MKAIAFLFLVFFMATCPVMALEPSFLLPHPQEGTRFDLSPSTFLNDLADGQKVVWIGEVEDVSSYINDQNETVIEYHCKYLNYIKNFKKEKADIYIVSRSKNDSFIFSIKAPEMSTDQEITLTSAIKKKAKIAVVEGIPYKVIEKSGETIAYITNDQVITTDNSIIEIEN